MTPEQMNALSEIERLEKRVADLRRDVEAAVFEGGPTKYLTVLCVCAKDQALAAQKACKRLTELTDRIGGGG